MKEIKKVIIEAVQDSIDLTDNQVSISVLNTLLDQQLPEQLALYGVVSSAWYCKISNQNGQWFEIVTGKNEMDVAVKITEKFGKQTAYNLIDRYELM